MVIVNGGWATLSLIGRMNALMAKLVGLTLSVARTLKLADGLEPSGGAPERRPPLEIMSQTGAPDSRAQLKLPEPPVAANCKLYGVNSVAAGLKGEAVVIVTAETAGLMVIESDRVAITALLSVTRATKLLVPWVVGVPVMAPLVAKLRPAGKLPELRAKV